MNLSAPFILLPMLTLVYDHLQYALQNYVQLNQWKLMKVKIINCSHVELPEQVLELLFSYNIPLTIATKMEDDYYPESTEVIIGDEFNRHVLRGNKSNQRIYLMHSKEKLLQSQIRGTILILIWSSNEVYCRNSLLADVCVENKIELCLSGKMLVNQNPRKIPVYVKTDLLSFPVIEESDSYALTGLLGMLLHEIKDYLNASFVYTLSSGFITYRENPFRKWPLYIKALAGVTMGRYNESLFIARGDPNR